MKIYGEIRGGMFSNMPTLYKEFQRLDGRQVTLTITKRVPRRSLPQNSYLWGIVYKVIADYSGYSQEEVHDSMRSMFLTDRSGDMPIIKSTTELSTEEFAAYVESIQRWAAEFAQLYIPDPQ